MDLAIMPECYVDTNLVETLVPPADKGYNHQKGCGTVTKVMKEKFSDSFAVGIIDKDKIEVEYLQECSIVLTSGSLLLHKHTTRHHYLIQIFPAIERMILSNAAAVGIFLEDFGLPSSIDELIRVTKTVNSKKDIRFKKLFKALRGANAPDFGKLEAWISYLKNSNYNVDIDEVRAL